MRLFALLLASFFLVVPVTAQTKGAAKTQLRNMTKRAGKDVEALVEAAKFATENGLLKERKKLITKILKYDKENDWANEALGRVRHEGKWIERKEFDKLIAKQLEAKYKAQGLQLVEGVWVKKEHAADAKRGVFHHDGEMVTKWEKQKLQTGHVRHPKTGLFIKESDLEKANKGLFPMPDGRWVDLEKANKFHSSRSRMWVIRTKYAYLMTTEPLEKMIDGEKSVKASVDGAIASLLKIFGGSDAPPHRRPVIRLASKIADYKDIGERLGGAGSVYGVFHNPQVHVKVMGSETGMTVMNYGEANWRNYFAEHAAGMALSYSFCGKQAEKVPLWFHRGVAAYVERLNPVSHAKFFGQQQDKRGGVPDLRKFFRDFEISPDVDNPTVNANLYVSGLLISFCIGGGDKQATEAMMNVTKAFEARGDVRVPIKALEKVLTQKQAEIGAYYQKLIQ